MLALFSGVSLCTLKMSVEFVAKPKRCISCPRGWVDLVTTHEDCCEPAAEASRPASTSARDNILLGREAKGWCAPLAS